jgi:CubicO group peptidase (beta-lactamase class C family)
MADLESQIDQVAAGTRFSGVVRIDRGGRPELATAYGLAHRGWQLPNTVDTRFAVASGTKGLTALTVASLIEAGRLDLDTRARSVLGDDLPLIDDGVIVEHLLGHRSGIGDYFDEDAIESRDRLRAAAARAPAGDHRGLPRRPGRAPADVAAR